MAIDQLCVGDEVFAQDEATGEFSLRRVVHTFVRKAAPIVAVTLLGTATPAIGDEGEGLHQADSGLVTLNTTEEHPFLVEAGGTVGVGEYLPGRWVQAASLRPGDEVRTASGVPAVVLAVQFTGRRESVYNIEVEGLHNYRVGPDGMVAHNGLDPFECWAGLRKQWSKHGPQMAQEFMMKAKNTPTGPFQGVFDATPEQVASIIARSVEPGKAFNGAVPLAPGISRVFAPGTGSEQVATQMQII